MSSDPTVKPSVTHTPDPTVTSPPADTPDTETVEASQVHYSSSRWFFTGIVRLTARRFLGAGTDQPGRPRPDSLRTWCWAERSAGLRRACLWGNESSGCPEPDASETLAGGTQSEAGCAVERV